MRPILKGVYLFVGHVKDVNHLQGFYILLTVHELELFLV